MAHGDGQAVALDEVVGEGERGRLVADGFHPPRAAPTKLRGPGDTGLGVFERDKREPATDGHRADLAEAFAEEAGAGPGAFEGSSSSVRLRDEAEVGLGRRCPGSCRATRFR